MHLFNEEKKENDSKGIKYQIVTEQKRYQKFHCFFLRAGLRVYGAGGGGDVISESASSISGRTRHMRPTLTNR